MTENVHPKWSWSYVTIFSFSVRFIFTPLAFMYLIRNYSSWLQQTQMVVRIIRDHISYMIIMLYIHMCPKYEIVKYTFGIDNWKSKLVEEEINRIICTKNFIRKRVRLLFSNSILGILSTPYKISMFLFTTRLNFICSSLQFCNRLNKITMTNVFCPHPNLSSFCLTNKVDARMMNHFLPGLQRGT